ncbi:TPA: pilin [Photobacterium damselae]
MKGQKGFTLIELMIVVAIIGVLSAIAIPAYQDYVKKSEMASAMATMKALITPAELLYQQHNSLSGGLNSLGIDANANTLGVIAVGNPASGASLTFTFNNGALNTKALTFNRNSSGWKCTKSVGMPDIEGCN